MKPCLSTVPVLQSRRHRENVSWRLHALAWAGLVSNYFLPDIRPSRISGRYAKTTTTKTHTHTKPKEGYFSERDFFFQIGGVFFKLEMSVFFQTRGVFFKLRVRMSELWQDAVPPREPASGSRRQIITDVGKHIYKTLTRNYTGKSLRSLLILSLVARFILLGSTR